MSRKAFEGCLLGLAVGDAMGYTVDSHTWSEIQEDYGPYGLRGYDSNNGFVSVTSYTQLAAFTVNGLLLGLTRGQMRGQMAPYIQYVGHALREWATTQRRGQKLPLNHCWLTIQPDLCEHFCMDTRMLDILSKKRLGTPEEPRNSCAGPQSLTTAIGVGLFFHPDRTDQKEIDRLGAEAVALTYGNPEAFLSGAVLSHMISRLVQDPGQPLLQLIQEAMDALRMQFGHEYSQAYEICNELKMAVSLARGLYHDHAEIMEKLRCETASQCLAGACYACLIGGEDLDASMIVAVNHSGRSAAVGAITGAIQGIRLGKQALPDFYLEDIQPVPLLAELAADLNQGCPLQKGSRLYDGDWDQKYLHGGR